MKRGRLYNNAKNSMKLNLSALCMHSLYVHFDIINIFFSVPGKIRLKICICNLEILTSEPVLRVIAFTFGSKMYKA